MSTTIEVTADLLCSPIRISHEDQFQGPSPFFLEEPSGITSYSHHLEATRKTRNVWVRKENEWSRGPVSDGSPADPSIRDCNVHSPWDGQMPIQKMECEDLCFYCFVALFSRLASSRADRTWAYQCRDVQPEYTRTCTWWSNDRAAYAIAQCTVCCHRRIERLSECSYGNNRWEAPIQAENPTPSLQIGVEDTHLRTRVNNENIALIGIEQEVSLFETQEGTDQFYRCFTIVPRRTALAYRHMHIIEKASILTSGRCHCQRGIACIRYQYREKWAIHHDSTWFVRSVLLIRLNLYLLEVTERELRLIWSVSEACHCDRPCIQCNRWWIHEETFLLLFDHCRVIQYIVPGEEKNRWERRDGGNDWDDR